MPQLPALAKVAANRKKRAGGAVKSKKKTQRCACLPLSPAPSEVADFRASTRTADTHFAIPSCVYCTATRPPATPSPTSLVTVRKPSSNTSLDRTSRSKRTPWRR